MVQQLSRIFFPSKKSDTLEIEQPATVSTVEAVSDKNPHTVFSAPGLPDWFPPLVLSASALAASATSQETLSDVLKVLEALEPDDILVHLINYIKTGSSKYGASWQYADILTVLFATSKLARPRRYLEIGVRRGRSLAMVASQQKHCEIYGFDRWTPNYAGMPNPGAHFVRQEMSKFGYEGKLEFIDGNSHETLPRFFKEHPGISFDAITVDGDHSESGAAQDILDVLPHLAVGGVIVFDDICHPKHPYLLNVWRKTVSSNSNFSSWEYLDLGWGVAFAIRKS
ncbi:MAG TPA: class I SAM-dependent methyltransferase [Candidatus Obscuribacterales bacterium]